MAKEKKQRPKGGSRKIGRSLEKCRLYRLMGKREINKKRKIAKHLKRMEKKAERKRRRSQNS